jgi:cysteine synthase
MNLLDEIIRFFVGLFRNRVDNVQIAARSKMMSAEAQLKSRVANQVNQRLDGAVARGKSVVTGTSGNAAATPQGRQPHPAAAKKT